MRKPMSCVIELFPSSRRANAFLFVPTGTHRAPGTHSAGSAGEQDASGLADSLSSLSLRQPETGKCSRDSQNQEPSPDSLTDDRGSASRDLPIHIKHISSEREHFFRLRVGAFGAVCDHRRGGIPDSGNFLETPKAGDNIVDSRATENQRDVSDTRDTSTEFFFQLPSALSSFEVLSSRTLHLTGGVEGSHIRVSLTLDKPVPPVSCGEQSELKALRSIKPFRVTCKQCKEALASVDNPEVLALPSHLWTEISEVVACEECAPVSIVRDALLAKPSRICVGDSHIALSPSDIISSCLEFAADKLVCVSCGSVVGFITTCGEAKHQYGKTDLPERSQQPLAETTPRVSHGHKCCDPAPDEKEIIKEFCFYKHRVCVPPHRDTHQADVFTQYSDVSLLAGNIESLCRKTGVHRFSIEQRDAGKSDGTENASTMPESVDSLALALKIVVRQCFFVFVQGESDGGTVHTKEEVIAHARRTKTLRAMKVLYKPTASLEGEKFMQSAGRVTLSADSFEQLKADLQRNSRCYQPALHMMPTWPGGWVVSYLPLPVDTH
ncbi:hypothetical protein CSUI_002304 [Cystoisospora suis]|uniref:Uncharacterized protein n=1 Tax=Cystoisospora suis TaxID=483139 RepID=A0A2C6L590_9APIC|nr:hypothetical protein CSUI_002304 [Cystoisospora suis]